MNFKLAFSYNWYDVDRLHVLISVIDYLIFNWMDLWFLSQRLQDRKEKNSPLEGGI